ncbi:unnamed protein product [Peniophora sp. CBMAI 1063]|nr:unnamed protein product [Peniophora sp. CBMAI 1063]
MDQNLPIDVLDYILSSILDLRTLCSTVQVSKRLNTVYKARQRSLRAAVARNEVGPALPAALRLARYDTDAQMVWQDFNWQGFTEDSDYEIDWALAQELSANAEAMCEFESLYSQMFKDCRNKTSQLTVSESRKFARALYRLGLYFKRWSNDWESHLDERVWDEDDDPEDEDDDGEKREWEETAKSMREDQLIFLKSTASTDEERRELCAAFVFLRDHAFPWAYTTFGTTYATNYIPDSIQFNDMRALARVLSRREHHSYPGSQLPFENSDVTAELVPPIVNRLGIDVTTIEPTLLLDGPTRNDPCDHCGELSGQKLFTESNWYLLYGYISLREICSTGFKGNLMRNLAEASRINIYFNAQAFSLPAFLREIFDGAAARGVAGADKNLLLCLKCVQGVVEAQAMNWWLDRKRAGQTIGDDCWYGYECRTQTHKAGHAGRLNHFCLNKGKPGPPAPTVLLPSSHVPHPPANQPPLP